LEDEELSKDRMNKSDPTKMKEYMMRRKMRRRKKRSTMMTCLPLRVYLMRTSILIWFMLCTIS